MNMFISSGGHLTALDRPRRDLDLITEFCYFYCTPGVGDHLSVLDRPRRDLPHDPHLQRSRPRDRGMEAESESESHLNRYLNLNLNLNRNRNLRSGSCARGSNPFASAYLTDADFRV